MLKFLLVGIIALVALITFLVARRPNAFRYQRSAVIDAPPDVVFAILNNAKAGEKWSPWFEMDPKAEYHYSEPEEGVGATVSWQGKRSGAGSLRITESIPNELVRLDFICIKPMSSKAIVDYSLRPEAGGTRIDWAMYGDQTSMGKLINLFIDCEKMVCNTTMKGFENLNKLLSQSR